jgi:hypothetical protein
MNEKIGKQSKENEFYFGGGFHISWFIYNLLGTGGQGFDEVRRQPVSAFYLWLSICYSYSHFAVLCLSRPLTLTALRVGASIFSATTCTQQVIFLILYIFRMKCCLL